MREKRFGYAKSPSVGYKTQYSEYRKINGKNVILIRNLAELEKVDKNTSIIIAKVGSKQRLEIIKYALDKKITIVNLTNGGKK